MPKKTFLPVIGTFHNTRTIVMRKKRILMDLYTPNILSSNKPIEIRIRMTRGEFDRLRTQYFEFFSKFDIY